MSRTVRIGGKNVTFSERQGVYYRDEKPVETEYQKRLARGVLMGLTPAEATGRKPVNFGEHEDKRLTATEIAQQSEFFTSRDSADSWAAPARRDKEGRIRHDYYIKVSVTEESFRAVGSDPKDGEGCVPATLLLLNPNVNIQQGHTFIEATRNFETQVLFTVERARLELCTGDLSQDLLGIWRHARR